MENKNNYSKLFKISLIFAIFWLVTCSLSAIESVIMGLELYYLPTFVFSVYTAISTFIETSGNVWDTILVFFESALALPLVIIFAGVIYFPIVIVVLLIYGVTFWIGVGYAAVSIVLIAISMVFSILLLVSVNKLKNDDLISIKTMKKAKVFAIIGLVSLIIAGAPNVFSLISILRYAFILVSCITAIIGVSRYIKANNNVVEGE